MTGLPGMPRTVANDAAERSKRSERDLTLVANSILQLEGLSNPAASGLSSLCVWRLVTIDEVDSIFRIVNQRFKVT